MEFSPSSSSAKARKGGENFLANIKHTHMVDIVVDILVCATLSRVLLLLFVNIYLVFQSAQRAFVECVEFCQHNNE